MMIMPDRLSPNPQMAMVLLKLHRSGRLPGSKELARALGYTSAVMVEQWFRGQSRPPLHILPKIAEIANIGQLWLLPPWLSDEDPGNHWLYADLGMSLTQGDPRAKEAFGVSLDLDQNPFGETVPDEG
jgi:transcriptional regulator with XRE-family HTH domain